MFLVRFPEGESVVAPRSHCRNCDHVLAWWENVPLASWIVLRGRCRQCRARIGIRYPVIELAVGILWVACWLRFGWRLSPSIADSSAIAPPAALTLVLLVGSWLLAWMLVALAILDAEYFWLPDVLTLPGVAFGILYSVGQSIAAPRTPGVWWSALFSSMMQALLAAGVVLVIRLAYWLIRRQEGMGLGDAKLMAMLGAWLGLRSALECFVLATFAAAAAALVWLAILALRRKTGPWATMPLPFGTFLCVAALSQVFAPHWLLSWWLPGV